MFTYEKLRYPLFWFTVAINIAAMLFCSWCLVSAVGKFGFWSLPSMIDVLFVGLNAYWLSKTTQRYRDMKQLDESIRLIDQLLLEVKAEMQSRQKQNSEPTKEKSE